MLPVAFGLLPLPLLTSGCGTSGKELIGGLARGAAEQPYQEAMQDGRLPPSEYQEIRAENTSGAPLTDRD
jgi:hypothetical protein